MLCHSFTHSITTSTKNAVAVIPFFDIFIIIIIIIIIILIIIMIIIKKKIIIIRYHRARSLSTH